MQSIDIVIPCYNYGRYLRECVDSVLGQHGCRIRILIIDDASTDGSVEVARDLVARDSRVELITHAHNKGHIATYNEGIAWTRQAYFLLLSADDLLAPGALKRASDLLDAYPGVAFVHGRAISFWGGAPPVETDVAPTAPRIVSGSQFIASMCANPVNTVTTATAVVRTSVQKKAGYYNHALPHAGDLEMWLRCALHGDVGEINHIQGFRRMHDSNMWMLYAADGLMIRDFSQRYQAFQIFFAEHDHDLNDGKQLRASANYQLADQMIGEARQQLRKRRLHSSLELLQLAFRVAPAIFLDSQWWLRGARWFWRRAVRILAGVSPRY